MTAAFIILSDTVFNEESKFCMIPQKYKILNNVMDTNNEIMSLKLKLTKHMIFYIGLIFKKIKW